MTTVTRDKVRVENEVNEEDTERSFATRKGWQRFIDLFFVLEKWLLYFSSGCIAILTLLLSYEIVQRKLFNRSLMGIEEILELSMIFITFLGLSAVQREESHLSVDLLYNKVMMSSKARPFKTAILSICFLFLTVFFVISCQYVSTMSASGEFTNTLHLPKSLFFVSIPFSILIFLIRLLIQMTMYRKHS